MKQLLLIFTLLFCNLSHATIYYVATTGNNANAGTSWATAKRQVQNAIALASSGDEIWIGYGTYLPTEDAFGSTAPSDNRDKTFFVPDGVKLYGGFDGSESTLLSRRNPNYFISYIPVGNYQTILSGDLGAAGNADNSYHVITSAIGSSGSGITLDGLIIRDGNANVATNPTINSLTVQRNRGGAMTLISATTSTVVWSIHNCIILSNASTSLGAGINAAFGNLIITNSMISSNTAGGSGGGLNYASTNTAGDGSVIIENTVFANNSSTAGVGGARISAPAATISNSTFFTNGGTTVGGTQLNGSVGTFNVRNSLYYNNTFSGSPTTTGSDITMGGATNTSTNCFLQLTNAASYAGTTVNSGTFNNTNPSFTNTADLDGADNRYFTADDGFSLASGSSAIGAGSNSAVGSQPKALGYNMRIMGTVDVGAYEAAGTGKVRWVNNLGATRPSTVTVDAVSQNVYPCTYTSISDAVDETIDGDIVYVTNGNYRNPNRLISTNCSIAGIVDVSASGGQDLSLYINVNRSNIMITSETGDYTTSSANLFGYGFNIMSGDNKTIRGFNMDSVRVCGFFNSNYAPYGTTARVSILNNKVKNTFGHGVKTDNGSGQSNRKFWAINGNWFENIGFYIPSPCTWTPSVSAIWLADAGDTCEIKNNTISNTKWAGFLCTGFGKNNLSGSSGSGKLTVSGNKISKTIDAGIQIGFPLSPNFYYPENADILDNYVTEANTSQKLGIGAITMLFSELPKVRIMGNHISNSYNGLAIDMPGWLAKSDTTIVSGNNFCGLVSGSFAVTHKAGYAPNCLCGTRDDLAKYKFANNYWGSPCGPTYPSNPAGNGERLRRDSTLTGGLHYSLNDFNFTPFATTPFLVVAAGTNTCKYSEIDIKGNNVSIVDGDTIPSLTDSTDFGTTSPLVRRFKIFNTGDSSLTISSIISSGTNASDFVVSGVPSSVAGGDSAAFIVTFTSGGAGARKAIITVNNSDCNEKVYDFAIKGESSRILVLSSAAINGIKFTRQDVTGSLISYGDASNYYFAIDTSGITSGALTGDTVTIQVNATIDSSKSSNGANQEHAMYLMPRFWDAKGSFTGTVKVRFPYLPADTATLTTLRDSAWAQLKRNNTNTLAVKTSKIEWFKTVGVPYNAAFIATIVGNKFPSTIVKPTVTYGVTGSGVHYVELGGITSFSGGGAGLGFGPGGGGGGVGLPVTWAGFDVKTLESGNELIWKTASEQNTDYFEVEYSYDAREFLVASSQLRAAGNSASLKSYNFTHPDFSSFVYYRIKQVDLDGQFDYSAIKLAKRTKGKEFIVSVYPAQIPDNGRITVEAKNIDQSQLNLSMVDVTGKFVYTNSYIPNTNSLREVIDLINLQPEVYFIEISNGQGREIVKVVR
jgi:hypothetical protein